MGFPFPPPPLFLVPVHDRAAPRRLGHPDLWTVCADRVWTGIRLCSYQPCDPAPIRRVPAIETPGRMPEPLLVPVHDPRQRATRYIERDPRPYARTTTVSMHSVRLCQHPLTGRLVCGRRVAPTNKETRRGRVFLSFPLWPVPGFGPWLVPSVPCCCRLVWPASPFGLSFPLFSCVGFPPPALFGPVVRGCGLCFWCPPLPLLVRRLASGSRAGVRVRVLAVRSLLVGGWSGVSAPDPC